MQKIHRYLRHRYKKLAAGLAGAACLSAALLHGLPGSLHLPLRAAKPPGTPEAAPVAEQTGQENAPPAPQIAPPAATPEQAAPGHASGAGQAARQPEQAAPKPVFAPAEPHAKPPAPKPPPRVGSERAIEMIATAYAPGPQDNDQWGSKTHLGTEVRPGVVAVDPQVVPLGSRVMIKYPDGHTEYAKAEDTGGAIKGRRIDVARWTAHEAKRFGIKPVKVYVLETPAERNEPNG